MHQQHYAVTMDRKEVLVTYAIDNFAIEFPSAVHLAHFGVGVRMEHRLQRYRTANLPFNIIRW